MAEIRLPEVVKKVAGIVATDNDATVVDTLISVGAATILAQFAAPTVHLLLPVVPGFVILPLTVGLIVVLANRLS